MNPTQTQTQSGPQVPSGLDPTAYILTKAIGYQENGGNTPDYTAQGASGEYGAYQYLPTTWSARASQFLGQDAPSLKDATPDQQNEVTYKWVQSKLAAGYTPAQVASMHNAGEGAPNAWQGNSGTNAEGVSYDTKSYAQGVQKYASQLWNGIDPATGKAKPAYGYVSSPDISQGADATDTSGAGVSTQGPPNTDGTVTDNSLPNPGQASMANVGANLAKVPGQLAELGGKLLPILPDLYNDIQGKSDKTILQQVGDAGMSAAWFLPFGDIAEGAGLGLKALGIGANTAKAAGVIGTGIGTGYLGGAASNLSQGQSLMQSFSPNAGTLTGAALGGGLSAAGLSAGALYNKFLGQQTIVNKQADLIDEALGTTKAGAKVASNVAARGNGTTGEFLSNAGIPLQSMVKEVDGVTKFDVGQDSSTYKTIASNASALKGLLVGALDKASAAGATSNIEEARQAALDLASKSFAGNELTDAQKQINSEFDGYKNQYAPGESAIDYETNSPIVTRGDNVPLSAMQKIKESAQGQTKYGAFGPTTGTKTQGLIAQAARMQVENDATAAGIPEVKVLNKLIQQHADLLGDKGILISRLHGQAVQGGKLRQLLRDQTGAIVGSVVGTALGGGPVGGIAGAGAGAVGTHLAAKMLQKLSIGGPLAAGVMGRMAREDPEIVQQFSKYLGTAGAGKIAPVVKPVETSAGEMMTNVLKRSPNNIFRGMSRRKAPSTVFGR